MFIVGNISGLIAILVIMGAACWIATFDPKCATAFGVAGLAAIIGAFIWRGHRSSQK